LHILIDNGSGEVKIEYASVYTMF